VERLGVANGIAASSLPTTPHCDIFRGGGATLRLAAVAIGAYLPPRIMKSSHTTPGKRSGFADVRGRQFLAIRRAFDLADEPRRPPNRLRAERRLSLDTTPSGSSRRRNPPW
jgi:hypothetical protein